MAGDIYTRSKINISTDNRKCIRGTVQITSSNFNVMFIKLWEHTGYTDCIVHNPALLQCLQPLEE